MNEIYNVDCFEGMKELSDKSVDYAFTSPPYNRKKHDKYALYDDTVNYNYFSFLVNLKNELCRICRKHIFINVQTTYYNKKDVYKFIGNCADDIQNIIVWEKTNPTPSFGNNVTNAYEYFIVLGENPLKGLHTYVKNHVTTSVNSSMNPKNHKAVMNYDVAKWCFDSFIPKGSSVIDPFMGCGTTALVALNNQCSYIGFEIVKEYCEIAKERVDSVDISKFL